MHTNMAGTLVLEDGSIHRGVGFGAHTDCVFELVFNTGMTGYQEMCSDPSYRGQGVLFTVPHIGNVGVNSEDIEASASQVSAVVVRAVSFRFSNWRAEGDFPGWLAANGVPGISGVDTRAITRKLRQGGSMKAALSTQGTDPGKLLELARSWEGLDGRDMVQEVTCSEVFDWQGDAGDRWVTQKPRVDLHVVLYDFGAKRNILRHLSAQGARVTVVPAQTSAEAVLALKPDGVMLSNGPGDPAGLPYAAEAVQTLIHSGIPIFGICLGHQLIGLALGGKTGRLKFGHHSANHPVQDVRTRKVLITSQNHNYMVLPETLDPAEVEVTHLSLNDGSLEGLRMKNKPVYCVQFHPEASPGPHDAHSLFLPFFEMMAAAKPF